MGGDTWEAECIGVMDGDTITVERGGRHLQIDLQGVDAPEVSQSYGLRALAFVSSMVHGETLTIALKGGNDHGALVARVRFENKDISAELLAAGLAWFTGGDSHLKAIHEKARSAHQGLWAESEPVPPWVFRGGKRPSALFHTPPTPEKEREALSRLAAAVELRGHTIDSSDAPPTRQLIDVPTDPLGLLGLRLVSHRYEITERLGRAEGKRDIFKLSWWVKLENTAADPRTATVRFRFYDSNRFLLHEFEKKFDVPDDSVKSYEGFDVIPVSTAAETAEVRINLKP